MQNVGYMSFPYFKISSGFIDGTSNDFQLDADGEKVAFIFGAPKAGDIHAIWARIGVVGTSDTLKFSLQTIDVATGDPDETVDESGTVATLVSNTNRSVVLDADRTVTKGERLAFVIEWNDFVGEGSDGDITIQAIVGTSNFTQSDTYVTFKTGGTWAKQSGRVPMFSIEYSDGSFAEIEGCFPCGDMVEHTFDSANSPDEIGNILQLPVPTVVTGFEIHKRATGGAGSDYDCVLYGSDGSTVEETISMDADLDAQSSNTYNRGLFPGTTNLTKDTNYRIVCKPTSPTATVRIFSLEGLASAAHLDQMPGGQKVHKTSQTDAGGWTEDTTARVFIAVLLSAFDDGVGGGGASGVRNPLVGVV